jgi:hypothetical protein
MPPCLSTSSLIFVKTTPKVAELIANRAISNEIRFERRKSLRKVVANKSWREDRKNPAPREIKAVLMQPFIVTISAL